MGIALVLAVKKVGIHAMKIRPAHVKGVIA
jgi:hypothetical protein